LNLLANKDIPQNGNVANHRGKYALVVEYFYRQIIHFQSICHVSHSFSIFVAVCYDYHFVIVGQKALCYVHNMLFHASMIRIKEIRHQAKKFSFFI
jgi:hypothetical protein